jgi:hypothetical protein
MHNNKFSEIFTCGNGVRQKEILFPFLFSLYLNDLETCLVNSNLTGLKTLSNELEQELGYYVKLFQIIYADDTVLLAESASNLQSMLNLCQEYCIKWKLKLGIDKTKGRIFSKGRIPPNIYFKYGDKELEIVKYFCVSWNKIQSVRVI